MNGRLFAWAHLAIAVAALGLSVLAVRGLASELWFYATDGNRYAVDVTIRDMQAGDYAACFALLVTAAWALAALRRLLEERKR